MIINSRNIMLASASTVYAGTTECPESMISRERSLRGMRRNRSPLLGRRSFDTGMVFWIRPDADLSF